MIRVQIEKNNAWVTQREKITMYSEGYDAVQIELSLSDEWTGLSKIGVFRAGDVQIDVAFIGTTLTIPVNAILQPNVHLFFGVYGLSSGRVAIPTTWADLGIIQPAADPTAASNYGLPVPDLYAQVLQLAQEAEFSAALAVTGEFSGTRTFTIPTNGEKTGHLMMSYTEDETTTVTDLGIVTAYGEALAYGYQGSEEEFQALLTANYGSAQTIAALQAAVQTATNTANTAENEAREAGQAADEAQSAVTALQGAVAAKQAKYKTATLTLASGASSWADQAAAGVTASNLVFWDVDPTDYAVAAAAQIHMTAQGDGVVSFEAVNTTTAAVKINLAIFD